MRRSVAGKGQLWVWPVAIAVAVVAWALVRESTHDAPLHRQSVDAIRTGTAVQSAAQPIPASAAEPKTEHRVDTNPSVAHAVVDLLPRRDSQPIQLELIGTSISSNGVVAFLREAGGPRSWRVRTGDSIEGMRVVAIETDRVTIGMGDRLDDLLLASGSAEEPLPRGVEPRAGIAVGNPSAALAGNQSRSINASATTIAKPVARGESASGDEASGEADQLPALRSTSAMPAPPTVTAGGPTPTLNSVFPPFDPVGQRGESANGDDASKSGN